MEVSINERINSNLYSDVINSYVDINSVTQTRNIVPGSYKETVVQATDQTLATLNSAGGQTLFTRFKLTPQVRNATLAQLAQIYFQYVIPGTGPSGPSLGFIIQPWTATTKEDIDDLCAVFDKMVRDGIYVTVGSEEQIEANADMFDEIIYDYVK